MNGNRTYWPRGKVLGGTSQINAMLYIRGNRRDYDTWEEMGNPGWGWASVLEYFKKSEDNTEEKYAQDNFYHATGGLLKVGRYGSDDETKNILKEAYKECGYKQISVSNSGEFLGYFDSQGTVFEGERFGTAKAFLNTAKGRRNLHIIKNAYVTKLLFDADGSVNGVQFILGDKTMNANAKKEVVVSAGSIGSPHLLMLSGIGPRDELQRHNIPLRKNLPVGLNLQDHVVVPIAMVFKFSNDTASTSNDYADQMYQYIVHRKGVLTNVGSVDLTLFLSTCYDTEYPDIQIIQGEFGIKSPGLQSTLTTLNLKEEFKELFTNINNAMKVYIFNVVLLNPTSRGHIGLASKSPLYPTKNYANYLHEQRDLDVLVKGIQRVQQFVNSKALAKHGGQLLHPNLPACDIFEHQSDAYWE